MGAPVGLIPAAGLGSRLGAAGSKELVATAAGAREERPAISWLLEAMGVAGIETAYLILRRGKWDIPERLGGGGGRAPRLAYLVTPGTSSIPESLDLARPFIGGRDVLMGFPDVVFEPAGAAADLLAAHRGNGADVTVALFESDRPDKTDMVELDGSRSTGGRVSGFRVKPGPSELRCTWILAAWGARFTRFLADHLERTGGQPPPASPLPELQLSQVMTAAIGAGLSIAGHEIAGGRFIDVGTPEDLARARAPGAEPRRGG